MGDGNLKRLGEIKEKPPPASLLLNYNYKGIGAMSNLAKMVTRYEWWRCAKMLRTCGLWEKWST